MTTDHWISLAAIFLWLLVPAVIFIFRHSIIAWISGGIQHHFNVKIEEVRTELRKSEADFNSLLRNREAEIAALRNSVLSGSFSRQALLDKRRFEAVEKVWTAVNDLALLKSLSASMAVLNIKAIVKEAADPKMQQFLSIIGAAAPDPKALKNVARDERPFLPELAWAYFSAYTTILYGGLARFSALKHGLDPDKYLKNELAQTILKAALPHQSKFIDEQEPESYYHLLEEIESLLLIELRRVLEAKDADRADTTRAKEIMDAISKADIAKAEEATAILRKGE